MTEPLALRFNVEWDSVDESVKSPELRATWARLQIWVNGACVTLVEDQQTGSLRKSVTVSAYPLAEWLVFNWWIINFDSRELGWSDGRRRSLRSVGDGFLWPNLAISPAGEWVQLNWRPIKFAGQSIDFVSRGRAWVLAVEIQSALSAFIEAVIVQLDEAGIHDSALQNEWAAVQGLDGDEVEFCRASARLGLDPFAEGADLAAELADVAGSLPPELLSDFVDAARPATLRTDAVATRNLLQRAQALPAVAPQNDFQGVRTVVKVAMDQSYDRPWEPGYVAARTLRADLGLLPTQPFAETSVLVAAVTESSALGPITGAGVAVADGSSPRLALPAGSGAQARRFSAARALWHASLPAVPGAFLLTRAKSSGQRAGRAFAAELLAPAEGIRELLEPGSEADIDVIESLASRFEVAETVIMHQIDNQVRIP